MNMILKSAHENMILPCSSFKVNVMVLYNTSTKIMNKSNYAMSSVDSYAEESASKALITVSRSCIVVSIAMTELLIASKISVFGRKEDRSDLFTRIKTGV
eukprot:m.42355 g.42355  ORF g.42355 m.42355 type:complete len:100 (-) comp9872_c0_seq2:640-939(-)